MGSLYVTEDWMFTPSTLTLKYVVSEEEIVLDPKTARLLAYLMNSHPNVCTREAIYAELYGIDNARADGTITAYVSKLRKIIEVNAQAKGKYIKTIPKSGYQFVGYYSVEMVESKVTRYSLAPVSSTPTDKVDELDSAPDVTTVNTNEARPSTEQTAPTSNMVRYEAVLSVMLAVILILIVLPFIKQDNSHQSAIKLSPRDWQVMHTESAFNHSVALSADNLFLAYVGINNNVSNLFVKSVLSLEFHRVYDSLEYTISSPAFSPSSDSVAFITRSADDCFVNIVGLDVKQQLIVDSHQQVAQCVNTERPSSLSFADKDHLLFISGNNHKPDLALYSISSQTLSYVSDSLLVIDQQNNKLTERLNESINDSLTHQLSNNYELSAFSYNSDNQQVAVLLNNADDTDPVKTRVYIINLHDYSTFHVVDAEQPLINIEWLNSQKLVVMREGQLQLVDINTKDIRPASLAQLKQQLTDT